MSGLTDIAVDTFSSMKNLVELKMTFNKRMQLSVGTFSDLANLEVLRLANNPRLAGSIKAGLFDGMPNLKGLFLFNTAMTTIEKGLFSGLGELRTLYMGNNAITTIPENAFAFQVDDTGVSVPMPLKKLWLNNNKLEHLTGQPFTGLHALNNLRLDGNDIAAVSDTVFHDAESLQYLFLHKNKLESISDNLFTGNKALVYLYLQDNQIATVHEQAFHGLTNLKIVALDNNKIASLKNAAFKDSALDHHAFKKNIPVHLHGNPVALEISRPVQPQKGKRVKAGGSLFEIESGISVKKPAEGKNSPFVELMKDSLAVSGTMEGCGKDPSSPCKTPAAKSLTNVLQNSVFEVVTIKPIGASNFKDTVAFAGKDLGVQPGGDPNDSLTSKMKVALSCDTACLEDTYILTLTPHLSLHYAGD